MKTDHADPGAAPPSRTQRPKSWRPGFTKGPKQWDPAKAAAKPSYPQTPEAHEQLRQAASERMRRQNAAGKMGRQGVPDGWAGRKEEVSAIRTQAAQEGAEAVQELRRQGLLLNDDPRAVEALALACAVVRDPTEGTTTRAIAARLVLAFTKAKPTARQEVTLTTGEDWLAELAARTGQGS
jgi:hypothetical protein